MSTWVGVVAATTTEVAGLENCLEGGVSMAWDFTEVREKEKEGEQDEARFHCSVTGKCREHAFFSEKRRTQRFGVGTDGLGDG